NVKKYSPIPNVRRFPDSSVDPPVVFPNPDPRSASTKRKPSSRVLQASDQVGPPPQA
ncbi:Uncharacterized protein FKW44_011775, partial [Caligus rogercresseyi]